MKIKDIALSAAAIGERVVKAIAIGAAEVWSAVKYLVFADPVVEQICVTNFSTDGVGITEEDAAKVTDIGTMFKGNTEITSFEELGKFTGVTSLQRGAFAGCTSLTRIDLSNIVSLEQESLNNCTSLVDAGDLSKLEVLREYSIRFCPLVGSLSLPNLKSISYGNFNSSNITEVLDLGSITNIPPGATTNQHAFGLCTNLQRVVLPLSLETLNTSFNGCTKLTIVENLNGHPNLKEIKGAFNGCPLSYDEFYLPNVEVYNPNFLSASIKKVNLIDSKITKLEGGDNGIFGKKNYTEEVILPDSIIEQTSYSFMGYSKIHTIRMSQNIKKIAYYGFYGCNSLENMELPDCVESIGSSAFYNCSKWRKEINLPNLKAFVAGGKENFRGSGITKVVSLGEVTSIPMSCFESCTYMTSANLPNTITEINDRAFYNCKVLSEVIIQAIVPPTLGTEVFYGTPTDMSIYVPDASVEAYKTASNWSTYTDRIEPMSKYVTS